MENQVEANRCLPRNNHMWIHCNRVAKRHPSNEVKGNKLKWTHLSQKQIKNEITDNYKGAGELINWLQ
jgi:hypothetical protein